MAIPANKKRAINEASVRQFFNAWDPAWRWMLILGLRDLPANLSRLGALAAEATDHPSWTDESYLYGPVALGITAAAVNECAQYAEDLFALLTFLREGTDFVKRMTSYSAGKVTGLATKLIGDDSEAIRSRYLIPPEVTIKGGVSNAVDPAQASAAAEQGVVNLAELTREVADWFLTYEFFHVQYKHGLKLPLRPFGGLPPRSTVDSRRESVAAPLLAFSNEPLSKMVARPPQQQAMMFNITPESQPYLTELVADRALLRVQLSGPEVDLDTVVGLSEKILRLLRIAAANRLAISRGLDENGMQDFQMPGLKIREVITTRLELKKPVTLADF